MSKLIVDMPMPKCCARCFLADENDRCSILGTVATQKGRMPNCPIKGVLPDEHGDLIDRDVLRREISVLQDTTIIPWAIAKQYADIAKNSALMIIDDQKPIIAATERSNNGQD